MGRTDVQFLLMGSGPEYDSLVKLKEELRVGDYVDTPGWAYDNFLFTALSTIDLGVTCDPPNSYNHSCTMNKVLEYMAFGKPQVTFDLVESRASAADAAVYVSEYSPVRLAEAIARTLDNGVERERMGRIGAERLQNDLSWGWSVEQLKRAYEAALS
jgi:glycosyltransferase involved in cell wall biosynthesis